MRKSQAPAQVLYKIPASGRSVATATMSSNSEMSTIQLNLEAGYGDNPLQSLDPLSSHRTKLLLFVTFIHPTEEGTYPRATQDQLNFECSGTIAQRHFSGTLRTLETVYATKAFSYMATTQPNGWIGGYASVAAQLDRESHTPIASARRQSPPPQGPGPARQPSPALSPPPTRRRRQSPAPRDQSPTLGSPSQAPRAPTPTSLRPPYIPRTPSPPPSPPSPPTPNNLSWSPPPMRSAGRGRRLVDPRVEEFFSAVIFSPTRFALCLPQVEE